MSSVSENIEIPCPICERTFNSKEIEFHVSKCLFLNSKTVSDSSHCASQKTTKRSSEIEAPQNSKIKKIEQTSTSRYTTNKPQHEIEDFYEPSASCSTPTKPKPAKDWTFAVPLAKQVQPKSIDDFFGQNNVLGELTMLRSLIQKGEIPNMILWGPPGCGKTSLSGVINEMCKADPKKKKFISLCAATCSVKDVQTVISEARGEKRYGRISILFMDEIHRFNKSQQDSFLLAVERGDIILIGATTENPSFRLNNALLSRCRVVVFEKLNSEDLYSILEKAALSFDLQIVSNSDSPIFNKNTDQNCPNIYDSALKWLADISDGDARIALNNLQITLQYYNNNNLSKPITIDDIKDGIKKSHLLYDRNGEEHYNIISAMHKSIRASDANAAVYWTTRMIKGGEDPIYIARRLVRAASEDVGNADPNALQLAELKGVNFFE